MKLLTRIYAIALLGLLALLAALLLLTQQAQQTRQAELQALRDGHLLRNLRTAAENYLATGLQLEQLEILQQVIAREQAAFAGVVAIDVFAAGGTVLYSTDVGNRGTQVPEGWRTWLARDLPWDSAAPGQRQIGTRFENDLGQAAGGIVVTFSTVPAPLTLAQWYERGQQAVQWLAMLALAGAAVAALLYAGLRQALKPYGDAARVLQGAPPPPGVATPLVQAAQAQRAQWDAARQRTQQGMRQLEELDHGV